MQNSLETALDEGMAIGRQEGIAIGREEGIAIGEAKKAHETALNFKKLGVDIELIAKATGLSTEEIEKLT